MNQSGFKDWKVLCWNVRGLNSEARQLAVKQKIDESGCSVVCLQETKCMHIDHRFIRKFCPRRFDNFSYVPSVGASAGMVIIWNSSFFEGKLIEARQYGIILEFRSKHTSEVWTLVSVYGPCQGPARDDFVQWLYNLDINCDDNWLLLGDFNFMRSLENRNLPGGNVSDIFLFNEVIGHLGLVELPIKGRQFTWSNIQSEPLLEQIDWFFTSVAWTSDHPNTLVLPLARTASDHVPCVVSIATAIPKAKVFRFENYWIELPGFYDCVAQVWNKSVARSSAALTISSKFKALRYALKQWHLNLSTVKALISD